MSSRYSVEPVKGGGFAVHDWADVFEYDWNLGCEVATGRDPCIVSQLFYSREMAQKEADRLESRFEIEVERAGERMNAPREY